MNGDSSRERKRFFEWSPSRSLLASIRSYQRPGRWRLLHRKFAVLRHRLWSVVTAADIPINSRVGIGLLIPHPTGIVIHPEAKIGPNCLILSCVTIGTREHGGVPIIGAHVDIGTGAKILGDVSVGDHARIGANAVVLRDVSPYSVVVGIPAREVHMDDVILATADDTEFVACHSCKGEDVPDCPACHGEGGRWRKIVENPARAAYKTQPNVRPVTLMEDCAAEGLPSTT